MPGVTPAEVLSNFGITLVEDPAENQPRLLVDLPAAELVEHAIRRNEGHMASNGALVTAVSKNKYAIAYLGIGYVNKSVKPLQVNGITASLQTAMSKAYPFSRELYMYTDGEPHGSIAKYIAFVKSAEGQKIVAREGFVPLMDAKKVSGRGKK